MTPFSALSTREFSSGSVTLLFTDIEGSTKLWQDFPAAMPAALARHHVILNHALTTHQGHVFQIVGDAFQTAFASALDGLNAALEAQRALASEPWGETGPIRVRMALHTDRAGANADSYESGEYAEGEYLSLARTARLISAAHSGQILLSAPTAEQVREALPVEIELRDLGSHRVKDFAPQQFFQITAPELPSEFSPLKTLGSLPNNLPLQLTSFVGREREIEEVKQWLTVSRLLTLTGPGGSGKTRLAIQVAADLIEEFHDGVYFVLPERQKTLRNTIVWSYDLLNENDQELFRRLSIFVGGCRFVAAETVSGESDSILDELSSLVDKSLLRQTEGRKGEPRFTMLETLREFGLEQLQASGEQGMIRERHANYYLSLAEPAEARLESNEQIEWLNQMEQEHDNLRAALEWSRKTEDQGPLCVRLANLLGVFWEALGHFSEGRERLTAVLATDSAQGRIMARAQLLRRAAELAYRQSDFGATKLLAGESLEISREIQDEQGTASALIKLGDAETETGDYSTALVHFEEALTIWRGLHDEHGTARADQFRMGSPAHGRLPVGKRAFDRIASLTS